MKKILLSFALGSALVAGAVKAGTLIDDLNANIVGILAPFQNEATVAQLAFATVETDATRALKVAVAGLYRKTGSQNTLELKIDNLSYEYGDGTAPITKARGSLSLDFTKLLPQDTINDMIPQAAELVEGIAKNAAKEYGDAVFVKGVVTSTTKDADGNYTGLTALLSAKIDLTKLPEGKTSEDIPATDAVLAISLNLKTGVSLDAFVVSNPAYKGFKSDQEGLKEALDKLLARDEKAMEKINALAKQLDTMAAGIVDKK